jgi:hypothetical protein
LSSIKKDRIMDYQMKMGISFLIVIAICVFPGSLSARQGGQRIQRAPEETAKMQVEWMTTDLKIDDPTQKKVYEVVLKYARLSSDERQKSISASDRDSLRAKLTEIMAARDKELKVILGTKNYELFKSKETERRQAMMPQR